MTQNDPKELVCVGWITGFRGLKGEVKVKPTSHDANWVETVEQVVLRQKGLKGPQDRVVTVVKAEQQGPQVLMKFQELPTRTDVETLKGVEILAYKEEMPELKPGEYRTSDLMGMTVVECDTEAQVGRVKDVLSSGGRDFLELEAPSGKETAVIPFIDQFFPDVDLENRVIYIARMSGLLDDFGAHENG